MEQPPCPPRLASRHNAPPRLSKNERKKKGDPRVATLLQLLGLQRYAQKFAEEEIDLVALRLLDDDDFTQLRIPDAARRRIAEAMHSVPILAQIQGEARKGRGGSDNNNNVNPHEILKDDDDDDDDILPTQKFQDSRLGRAMRLEEALFGGESSDGEVYQPTQLPHSVPNDLGKLQHESREPSPSRARESSRSSSVLSAKKENPSCPKFVPKRKRSRSPFVHSTDESPVVNAVNRSTSRFGSGSGNAIDASPQLSNTRDREVSFDDVPSQQAHGLWSSSSGQDESSSNVSSLQSFDLNLHEVTQCSLHAKVDRWRRKQLSRERRKHNRELKRERKRYKAEVGRIEARYLELQKQLEAAAEVTQKTMPPKKTNESQVVKESAEECIDLTQCISSDEDKNAIEKPAVSCEEHINIRNSDVDKRSTSSSIRVARNDDEISSPYDLPEDAHVNESFRTSGDARNDSDCSEQPSVEISEGRGRPIRSDDEVMDLIVPEKNILTALQDEDTRQSNGGISRTADNLRAEPLPSQLGLDKPREETDTPAESRLKKKPRKKATREDLLVAIHKDVSLHDDILRMTTVDFMRVHESVLSSRVRVSKQALHEFLLEEGVAFKPESKERDRGKRSAYFRNLAVEYN